MLAADDKQRPLEYGDDEPGVEDALELHYDSDSDDEAIAGQEGDPAPTEPMPTPTSPAAIVSKTEHHPKQLPA